jgi:hypothetical protein
MLTRLMIKRSDSYNISPDKHVLFDGEPVFTRYTKLSELHPIQPNATILENYLEVGNVEATGGHGRFVNAIDLNVLVNETSNILNSLSNKVVSLDNTLYNMDQLKLSSGISDDDGDDDSNRYVYYHSTDLEQLLDYARLNGKNYLKFRYFNEGDMSNDALRWEWIINREDELISGVNDYYGFPEDEYGNETNLKLISYGLFGSDLSDSHDVIEYSSKINSPIKIYKPTLNKKQIMSNVEEVLKYGDFEGLPAGTGSGVLNSIGWKAPSLPTFFKLEANDYSEPIDTYKLSDVINVVDAMVESKDSTTSVVTTGPSGEYNVDVITNYNEEDPVPVYTTGMMKPSDWYFTSIRETGIITSPTFSWDESIYAQTEHKFSETQAFRVRNKGYVVKIDSEKFTMQPEIPYRITVYAKKNNSDTNANIYISLKNLFMGSSFYSTIDGKRAAFNWDPHTNGQIKAYYGNMTKSTYDELLDGWANASVGEWVRFTYFYTPQMFYDDMQIRVTVGTSTEDEHVASSFNPTETLSNNDVSIGLVSVDQVVGVDQISKNLPPSGGTQTLKLTTSYPGVSPVEPSFYSHFFSLDVNSWYILKMAYRVIDLGAESVITPNVKNNNGIYHLEWYTNPSFSPNIVVKRPDSNNTSTQDGVIFTPPDRYFFAWYEEYQKNEEYIPKLSGNLRTRIAFQDAAFQDSNPKDQDWIKMHYAPKNDRYYLSAGDTGYFNPTPPNNIYPAGTKGDTYVIEGVDSTSGVEMNGDTVVYNGDVIWCKQDTVANMPSNWELIQEDESLTVPDKIYDDYVTFKFVTSTESSTDPKVVHVTIGNTAPETMNNFRDAFNNYNWGSDYVGWKMDSDPIVNFNLYAPSVEDPWVDPGFKYNIGQLNFDNMGEVGKWQTLSLFIQPAKSGGNLDTDHERTALQIEFTKNTVIRPMSLEIDYISLKKLNNYNYLENMNVPRNALKTEFGDYNLLGGELSVSNQGTEILLTRNPNSPIPWLVGVTHDIHTSGLSTDARFGVGVRGTNRVSGKFTGNQMIAFHSIASSPTPSGRKTTIDLYAAGDADRKVWSINADTGLSVHEGNIQLNKNASLITDWDTERNAVGTFYGDITANSDSTSALITGDSTSGDKINKEDYITNSSQVMWPTDIKLPKPENWTLDVYRHYTNNPHPIFMWDNSVYTQEMAEYIPPKSLKIYNRGFSIKMDSPTFSMTAEKRYLVTVYVRKNSYIDHRGRIQTSNANLYLSMFSSVSNFFDTADGKSGAFNWKPDASGHVIKYYGNIKDNEEETYYKPELDGWRNAEPDTWVKFSYYFIPTIDYNDNIRFRITIGTKLSDRQLPGYENLEEELVYNNVNIGYVRIEEVSGMSVIKEGTGNHIGDPAFEITDLVTRNTFTLPVLPTTASHPSSAVVGSMYLKGNTLNIKTSSGWASLLLTPQ